VDLTVVAGRISEPDGLAYWERLDGLRRKELPISTRDALRFWRVAGWPPMEWRTGPLDWVYCPSEMFVPTRKAKLAVTSHDVLQDVRLGGPRRQALLDRIFDRADLVLSVSKFNTSQLLEMYPVCRGKVAYVPNAAEEIFFGEAATRERAAVRPDFGLPPGMPYLISVASFQARKNLVRLVKAAGRLREVENGELALVLLGAGAESEAEPIRRAIEGLGRKAVVKLPGYRQGRELLAAYAEATALVFPSTCESFGIPAVEAMAQRIPVALANSTALPEIGGEAGWYFKPTDEQAIATTLREMLDNHEERDRRVQIGRALAEQYRWQAANDLLVEALRNRF
jgi:glycosyltransferase involved in cell wall biosynthesis